MSGGFVRRNGPVVESSAEAGLSASPSFVGGVGSHRHCTFSPDCAGRRIVADHSQSSSGGAVTAPTEFGRTSAQAERRARSSTGRWRRDSMSLTVHATVARQVSRRRRLGNASGLHRRSSAHASRQFGAHETRPEGWCGAVRHAFAPSLSSCVLHSTVRRSGVGGDEIAPSR